MLVKEVKAVDTFYHCIRDGPEDTPIKALLVPVSMVCTILETQPKGKKRG
jgi:hypothetical protein